MNASTRAAVAHVLSDLVKADGVIDYREMDHLRKVRADLHITRTDEQRAAAMTLAQALDYIYEEGGDSEELSALNELLAEMTVSDAICTKEEALLSTAIAYRLGVLADRPESDVISVKLPAGVLTADAPQMIYVESSFNKAVNTELVKNLSWLKAEMRVAGIELVYVPEIIHHYLSVPHEMLHEIAAFLSPETSDEALRNALIQLRTFKTDTFCREQLQRKLGFEELRDTAPAMLVRIGVSQVSGEQYVNFLRMYIPGANGTQPQVQKVVHTFAEDITARENADFRVISCNTDVAGRFLYRGFHRQMFDIMLMRKEINTPLVVDLIHNALHFGDSGFSLKDVHRKERALFILLAYESLTAGGINFSIMGSETNPRQKAQTKRIITRFARIYAELGGNESVPDITKDAIRLPMLASVRRAVQKLKGSIYQIERFNVRRDDRIYRMDIDPNMLTVVEGANPKGINAEDSALWKMLDGIV